MTRLLVSLLCAAGLSSAYAQTVFDAPSASPDRLKLQPSEKFFVRLGYTYIKPNTKSQDTEDLSGPVIRQGEISGGGYSYDDPFTGFIVGGGLDVAMQQDGLTGLGIPTGVRSEAKGAGTPTVELGMFLDEERMWAVQGFVLALPFDNKIEGAGTVFHRDQNTGEVVRRKNNYLAGKNVVETKQLPPTFVLNRYFGSYGSKIRPSLGLGVTYAIFFESKATDVLNEYSGGKTDVKIKNAFGIGPFMGLQYQLTDKIHLSAALGYIKLKTEAKLTTRNTVFTADSPVLVDYSGYVGGLNQDFMEDPANKARVEDMLATIRAARGGSLGSYTRRLKTELDPWVFNVSVGYSF